MKKLLWNLWDHKWCTNTLFTEEKSKHAAQEKKKGKENTQNVSMLCIQTAHKRVRERSRGRQRCFQWFCSRVSWWLSSTLEGLLGNSDQEEEDTWKGNHSSLNYHFSFYIFLKEQFFSFLSLLYFTLTISIAIVVVV